jgi:hypothetical protein
MDRELYANTISGLVEYFEGYEMLAVILNVNVDDLRRWAEGKSRPPVDVFLRMADLTERQVIASKRRAPIPPMRIK